MSSASAPVPDMPPAALLPEIIADHGKWRAHRVAAICGDQVLTWADLCKGIDRCASALAARGVRHGDHVAFLPADDLSSLQILLGIVRAGAVLVPLSCMLQASSVAGMVRDSKSRLLLAATECEGGLSALAELLGCEVELATVGIAAAGWEVFSLPARLVDSPHIEIRPHDDFNIIYTSGTTGQPKGIVHTHHGRFCFAVMHALEARLTPASVSMLSTPLYTNGSWILLSATLLLGGTVVILGKFSGEDFLSAVERHRVTHAFLAPTQIRALLSTADMGRFDLGILQILISAASPLRPEEKEEIVRHLGCALMDRYGVTEGFGTTLRPEDMRAHPDSVGTPSFGIDIRIVGADDREVPAGELGEIVGRGPALMKGYFGQPALTRDAMWLDPAGRSYVRTGDIGRIDDEGFLYLVDRKKDMIISGGINVYPSDIERLLSEHPDVLETAVVGVPDEKWGERPLAFVVRRPGADTPELELMDWVNRRVAKYQRIVRLQFIERFPRNSLGKVIKRELKEHV